MTSYEVLAYVVTPTYDERGDRVELVVQTESRDAEAMKTLYDTLVKSPLYRVRLSRIERTVASHKVEFRPASNDNPFVT